jgi:DNA-binding Lrp family transcriptional regulator
MDEIDSRLLTLLQEDASRPLKTLAAEVGLARSSVRERIARMEANGTIRRYTIEIASADTRLTAILRLRLARTPAPETVRAIVALPEVFQCRSLSGDIDLLVEISAADIAEINRTRDRIAHFADVVDVETAFVLNVDKAPA